MRILKVDIASLDRWLKDNSFEETVSHGVRNFVQNQCCFPRFNKDRLLSIDRFDSLSFEFLSLVDMVKNL